MRRFIVALCISALAVVAGSTASLAAEEGTGQSNPPPIDTRDGQGCERKQQQTS